jgi:DNA-binding PadR family transcriptional regulator
MGEVCEERSQPDLPATSWAVLGLLSFDQELSGYDIKRWADQSLSFFYWAPSQSQIYAELRRLEGLGLAVSRVEQTHTAKSRRMYAISDAGKSRMREWAERDEIDAVVLKHPLLLRVWAAHNGSTERLVHILAEYRAAAVTRASLAAEHSEHASAVRAWEFSVIALEWSTRYYDDEVARIDWLIDRLATRPS